MNRSCNAGRISRPTGSPLPRLPLGPFAPLSAEARAASLMQALAGSPEGDAVWLFAYGSLMWDPCFAVAERRSATLDGFRRGFNVWTALARGTPERPGLGLGLEPGDGRCRGIAWRLDPDRVREGLEAIWRREMHTAIYRPHWLNVGTGDGDITALTFVVDPAHPQFAGGLPPGHAADLIAAAAGKYGSCRDYLADAVAALAALGIDDPDLTTLHDLVTARISRDAGRQQHSPS